MHELRPLRDVGSLLNAGLVADDPALERVALRYAVALTPAIVDLIDSASDPIARQFLPDARELLTAT